MNDTLTAALRVVLNSGEAKADWTLSFSIFSYLFWTPPLVYFADFPAIIGFIMTVQTLKPQEGLLDPQHSNCQKAYEASSTGSSSANCNEDNEVSLEGPYDRLLGDTEHNWCRAVAGGTGITVLGVLFSRHLDSSNLQLAIDVVQLQHPRLRSQLVWIHGRPAFQVCSKPFVKVEVLDRSIETGWSHEKTTRNSDTHDTKREDVPGENSTVPADDKVTTSLRQQLDLDDKHHRTQASEENIAEREWLTLVEDELNTNLWPQREHSVEPVQMFVVRIYRLPKNRSLMILRMHTAVCDRVSAATVLADILKALLKIGKGELLVPETTSDLGAEYVKPSQADVPTEEKETNGSVQLMSVEAAIPQGKANKPFWAHGIDLLGYSLGTRRHAMLPFEELNLPRRSELIRSSLSREHTQALLQGCAATNASLCGALCAAGLKAAAVSKQLGNRSEHFAVISLVDCRRFLGPAVSDSTVGFYHSALMTTHHLNETTAFWELAKKCSDSVDNAMKSRKHFTDMGDLNYLMYQAICHPNLTPSGSLRTSLLVTFNDTMSDDFEELPEVLGLEDYIGCSSIHGVGPSLAIFDTIQHGELHCANVYPAPLHSRAQIQTYVDRIMDNLLKFLP